MIAVAMTMAEFLSASVVDTAAVKFLLASVVVSVVALAVISIHSMMFGSPDCHLNWPQPDSLDHLTFFGLMLYVI